MTGAAQRPLTALLAANVISIAGSAITLMGIPWLVLQSTGSAADAGIVAFCAMLPVTVSALAGGPLVDRMGRRRVSVVSDLVCGTAIGAVPLLQFAGVLQFWMLCALMALTGLFHSPGDTARGALLPAVALRADVLLGRAVSFYDGASRCASMIGSAAGGVLIALLGANQALTLDAATFAISALLIASGLRDVPEAPPWPGGRQTGRPTYRSALREGIQYVRASPLLLGICLITMLAQGLDQGWTAVLLPVHVRDSLGGAPALGLLEALFAAGALAGALTYAAVGSRVRRWPVYAIAFIIVGAPRFIVAASTGTLTPLATMMTIEGLACGVINPILATATYEIVPDSARSRVLGVTTASALLIAPLGGLLAGLLVSSVGMIAALLTVGLVYLFVTLCPAIFPVWRQLDHSAPRSAGTDRPDACEPPPTILTG